MTCYSEDNRFVMNKRSSFNLRDCFFLDRFQKNLFLILAMVGRFATAEASPLKKLLMEHFDEAHSTIIFGVEHVTMRSKTDSYRFSYSSLMGMEDDRVIAYYLCQWALRNDNFKLADKVLSFFEPNGDLLFYDFMPSNILLETNKDFLSFLLTHTDKIEFDFAEFFRLSVADDRYDVAKAILSALPNERLKQLSFSTLSPHQLARLYCEDTCSIDMLGQVVGESAFDREDTGLLESPGTISLEPQSFFLEDYTYLVIISLSFIAIASLYLLWRSYQEISQLKSKNASLVQELAQQKGVLKQLQKDLNEKEAVLQDVSQYVGLLRDKFDDVKSRDDSSDRDMRSLVREVVELRKRVDESNVDMFECYLTYNKIVNPCIIRTREYPKGKIIDRSAVERGLTEDYSISALPEALTFLFGKLNRSFQELDSVISGIERHDLVVFEKIRDSLDPVGEYGDVLNKLSDECDSPGAYAPYKFSFALIFISNQICEGALQHIAGDQEVEFVKKIRNNVQHPDVYNLKLEIDKSVIQGLIKSLLGIKNNVSTIVSFDLHSILNDTRSDKELILQAQQVVSSIKADFDKIDKFAIQGLFIQLMNLDHNEAAKSKDVDDFLQKFRGLPFFSREIRNAMVHKRHTCLTDNEIRQLCGVLNDTNS